ncbi:MAG: hypothetical protein ACI92S_000171, partial [Planctomycetaceae bacterium]
TRSKKRSCNVPLKTIHPKKTPPEPTNAQTQQLTVTPLPTVDIVRLKFPSITGWPCLLANRVVKRQEAISVGSATQTAAYLLCFAHRLASNLCHPAFEFPVHNGVGVFACKQGRETTRGHFSWICHSNGAYLLCFAHRLASNLCHPSSLKLTSVTRD